MTLFSRQPMAFGAWFAMIPYIKDVLGVSKGQLAAALLSLGASIGFPRGVSTTESLDDSHEVQNIATMAMSAFPLGRPLIGLVSEVFSLRVAFMGLFPGLCLPFWRSRVFLNR